MWFFGPAELAGCAKLPAESLGLETDGVAELLLRHESGVLSSVHLNFVQRDYRRTCQVIGTEGTIYWDFQSNRVDIYGADGQLRSYLPNLPDWQLNEMYIDELAQFTGRVSSRRPTINPVATALKTLELALAARIS